MSKFEKYKKREKRLSKLIMNGYFDQSVNHYNKHNVVHSNIYN